MIGAALELVRDILRRDPPFVRGGGLSHGEVPVFTFHTLEPASFERRIRFLASNGYRTPTLAEYATARREGGTLAPRSVLLTIDDGRATTWTVGEPILRRHGLRAVAFLVTSVVGDATGAGPQWDGATDPGSEREESGERPFVSWAEVERMRDVIEPESHTHRHARIPTGPNAVTRLRPEQRRGYAQFDTPFLWYGERECRGADLPPDYPLPPSAPRLSESLAYRGREARFETADERRASIVRDLADARTTLKEKAGRDSLAVCYPWHVAASDVPPLARDVGYRLGFTGKRESDLPDHALFRIERVGEDYVERLPGAGRVPLARIILAKLSRRLGRG